MCPFSTETDPNRFKYDSARALSSVPQPHSGYTDQSGMCAKTTIGVLLFSRLTSFSSHSSCSFAEAAETAGLQIHDVDEADEVHAGLIEAVPAGALRPFPESLRDSSCRRLPARRARPARRTPAAPVRVITCCSVSNSDGFDRWVRSPVCSTNDGCSGAALIFATAARSVPVTSVFAGLSKPMWLSLICTKRRPPPPCPPCPSPSRAPPARAASPSGRRRPSSTPRRSRPTPCTAGTRADPIRSRRASSLSQIPSF